MPDIVRSIDKEYLIFPVRSFIPVDYENTIIDGVMFIDLFWQKDNTFDQVIFDYFLSYLPLTPLFEQY